MRRLGQRLGRVLWTAFWVWAITFGAVVTWTALWPTTQPIPRGDVIICLGAGVTANGTLGHGSVERAETCGALFEAGSAPLVLFTGGPAAAGAPSAAERMAALSGVPAEASIIEPLAQSTLQNALFSLPLLPDDTHLILVSEGFHLPRAQASFWAFGASNTTPYASSPLREDGHGMLFRESLAIWFNLARYGLWRAAALLPIPEDTRTNLLH